MQKIYYQWTIKDYLPTGDICVCLDDYEETIYDDFKQYSKDVIVGACYPNTMYKFIYYADINMSDSTIKMMKCLLEASVFTEETIKAIIKE